VEQNLCSPMALGEQDIFTVCRLAALHTFGISGNRAPASRLSVCTNSPGACPHLAGSSSAPEYLYRFLTCATWTPVCNLCCCNPLRRLAHSVALPLFTLGISTFCFQPPCCVLCSGDCVTQPYPVSGSEAFAGYRAMQSLIRDGRETERSSNAGPCAW
jgi:hypothetical protein